MNTNTLQESKSTNQPEKEMSTKTTPGASDAVSVGARKPKTPLRKEELERIAQELKKKLLQASVTAKQLLSTTNTGTARNLPPDSPVSLTALPKSSPLKNYYMWRRQIADSAQKQLTLLPSLYSPGGRLPTLTKPSMFLSSSPLKQFSDRSPPEVGRSRKSSVGSAHTTGATSEGFADPNDSPIKRRRADSGAAIRMREPHMVLQPIKAATATATAGSPSGRNSLHPSPVLTSNPQRERALSSSGSSKNSAQGTNPQTTPTLPKKQLSTSQNALLKTPTQPGRGDAYNDAEGADLLMYLATSPSVLKPYMGNTPRAPATNSAPHNVSFQIHPSAGPNGGPNSGPSATKSAAAGNQFIAPPPPLTPKRPHLSSAKTPQNRLTPSVFGSLAVPGSALPSAGLALTPAGFNLNDYLNFCSPSPGGAALSHANNSIGRTLLKTPDFHGLLRTGSQTPVDGKMINFDKAELFGSSGAEPPKD